MDLYTDLLFFIETDANFEETDALKEAREYIDAQMVIAEKPIIKTL